MSSSHPPAEAPRPGIARPTGLVDGVVVGLGAAGALAVAAGHRATPLLAAALAGAVVVSAWLSIIDFREHRLPNRIVGPLAAAATAVVVVAGLAEGDPARTARALGLGLAVSAVLLAANLLGGMGMGDVKYGFPVGVLVGWFGWDALVVTILVTTAAGGLVAVGLLVRGLGRGHHLSYGPYMALGLVAGLLAAAPW